MREFWGFYERIREQFPDESEGGRFLYLCAPGESVTIDTRRSNTPPKKADVEIMAKETLGDLFDEVTVGAELGDVGIGDGSIVVWLNGGYYLSFSPETFDNRRVFMNVGRRGDEPPYSDWKDRCFNLLVRYFD